MINETFDATTANRGKALAFLQSETMKFGAEVIKKMNPHDFGMYPSFELYLDIDDPETMFDDDDESPEALEAWEKWDKAWDDINRLHEKYGKRFEKWL